MCRCIITSIAGQTNTTAEQKRIWKEIGAYLSESTMQQSPSSLLRNFSGSFHGVLPPSPNVIYSQNALVGSVVNVNSEAYFPACTAYWYAVLKRDNNGKLPKHAFLETNGEANRNGTIFSDLKSTPHILRNKIIDSCAKNESECPFPTYDLVIDVHQVFSHGFFHFIIEGNSVYIIFIIRLYFLTIHRLTEASSLIFDSLASHWTSLRWTPEI